MRQGINFATRSGLFGEVALTIWRLTLVVLLLLSGIHLWTALALRAAVREVAEQSEAQQSSLRRLDQRIAASRAELESPAASQTISQLVSLERSGIADAPDPSRLLSMLADVLPDEARVISLRLGAASPVPLLELESVTADPQAAVELLSGLIDSPLVRRAALLEEQPLASGEFLYRIETELNPAGTK